MPFSSSHSSINAITGLLVFVENSELSASLILRQFLAYSITANCMPKQIPKKGILFKREYSMALIFPFIPLSPKPPGTIIPWALESSLKISDFLLSEFK